MLQAFKNLLYNLGVFWRNREDQLKPTPQKIENLVPVYDQVSKQLVAFVSPPATTAGSVASQLPAPPSGTVPLPPTFKGNSNDNPPDSTNWDYWPDGTFDRDFSFEEVNATSRLMCHWAMFVGGGDRKGKENATSWENGKKSTRSCLGVIQCDNPDCVLKVRPHTKAQSLNKQIGTSCDCGAQRFHQKCTVKSILWTWSGGIHFRNEGSHRHPRLPRILHLSNDQQSKFESMVKQYPNTGPLGLIVGVPGVEGPGQSVADISDVYLNADRVSKERLKIKNNTTVSGDNAESFITSFSQLDEDHPNFVRLTVLGKVSVISMQTPFMAGQVIHDDIEDSPINGLVNDAAHGWWKTRNSLLMVTSSYCPTLHCWVPVLFSYTNGATSVHFKHHFFTLFQSIALQTESQKMAITDRLFVGVMDFSEAERTGFIEAFVAFWSNRGDDSRTETELRDSANQLLRGCQEHFRAGVTRLSRISGVIPIEKRDAFVQRAVSLVSVPTKEDFSYRAKLILRDFPKTASWLNWWIRPSHASMLFEAHRIMDIDIWDSIPVTTNAEEAMNWKLYAAAGRNHSLMEGLRSLYAVAAYYERCFRETSRGVPIRYGKPERWKMVADQIGRTKPTRAPDAAQRQRKKNDGRPPDTSKELLNKKTDLDQVQQVINVLDGQPAKNSKKKPVVKPSPLHLPPAIKIPSYKWKSNSCWLDTTLELLYAAVSRNFDDFEQAFEHVTSDSSEKLVYITLATKLKHRENAEKLSGILTKQRNKLRSKIVSINEASTMSSYEPLFSWFHGLLSQSQDVSFKLTSYFDTLITENLVCSGSKQTAGQHLQIRHIPHRTSCLEVETSEYDITKWFAKVMSRKGTVVSNLECWRQKKGNTLCSGVRSDSRSLVISIPVVLILRLPESSKSIPSDKSKNQNWKFPDTLTPLTKTLAQKSEVIYDLVGIGLYSAKASHFTARYTLLNASNVYSYDGMKNDGHAVQDDTDALQDLPEDYTINTVVYVLRGGRKAQAVFFQARQKELSKRFDIDVSGDLGAVPKCTYSGRALVELDNRARVWTKSAQAWKTKEYVLADGLNQKETDSKPPNPKHVPRLSSSDLELLTKPGTPESEDSDLETKPTVNRDASPASSLPDSAFTLNCRCGVNGDGNILYRTGDDGVAIKCDQCEAWSHVACQRDGRASLLKGNDKFICDFCDAPTLLHPKYGEKERTSRRRLLKARLQLKKTLTERLLPGRGGLARNGEFWYPVRLIDFAEENKTWTARWWRGCQFEESSTILPGSTTAIPDFEIVDSLWGDRISRRKIRLGIWTHSHEIPTVEDIIADPSFTTYTPEMHKALSPSIETLQKLMIEPKTVENVPAKIWLERQGLSIHKGLVPFAGNLSVVERAQLGNWFEVHVALNDKSLRMHWLGLLPHAHVCTLWLVALLRQNKGDLQKFDPSDHNQVLEAAWQLQTSASLVNLMKDRIDVDKECLERLEEEMFERSALAGKAGKYQWGLDAGDHQGGWNPYLGTEHWIHDDFPEDTTDDEILYQHGPDYVTVHIPPVKKRPQPKPRPLKSRHQTKK